MLCRLLIQWAIYDGVQGLVHRVEGVRLLLLVLDSQDHTVILAVDGLSACDPFLSFINYKDIGGFRGNISIN